MKIFNKIKKAQGLPLNTIVIAILVVIVLLVIVVFFTTNVARSGEQIGQVSGCSDGNAALTTVGWTDIKSENSPNTEDLDGICKSVSKKRISFLPSKIEDDDSVSVCCGVNN